MRIRSRRPGHIATINDRRRLKEARRKFYHLRIESLEDRVVPDATALEVLLTNRDPMAITLRVSGGEVQVVPTADPTAVPLAARPLSDVSDIRIVGDPARPEALTIDYQFGGFFWVPGGVAFDGGAGPGDTLAVQAPSDLMWTVTGPGAGTIDAGATFTGVENLVGAPDNRDTFVFESGGSLAGTAEGGAGGFDTLTLAAGYFSTVGFATAGPDAGTISRDADRITYSGFEPILDTTTGPSRTFTATAGADRVLVTDEGAPADNRFAVRSNTGEDVIFTQASTITSLTVNTLGGADTIVVQAVDTQFTGGVTIDGGSDDDDVTVAAITGPGTYTVAGGAGAHDAVRFAAPAAVTLTNTFLNGIVLSDVERAFVAGTTLAAATFTGQVVFTGNSPQWTEQGPLPYSRGFGLAPNLWDPAAGAVQAVAVDPTDPLTMYVGTTNGGVWRNTGSKAVYFALNESTLTADDKATLDAFANFLEEHPLLTVEVGGHTDASGTPADNLTISQQRAQAARDYLVNTRRIDPGRLTVRGFGADRPVAQNDATGLQPLNRRVELLVNNWEPVTDAFPSLSVSSLAISPLNSQVLYAGLGRSSSNGFTGGVEDGLLFSNNGGDTWRVLGQQEFAGLRITKVLPTTLTGPGGQVVFVSTFDVDRDNNGTLDDAGGVFRGEIAADGTGTFVKISNAGSGLPAGHYTDLVMDPGSAAPARPVRLYAAGPAAGVFQFTDGTDGQWHAANTGFQFGTDTDADGNDDLLQTATRVKLAVHEGSGTLYAGVIGNVDGNGIFNLTGTRTGLIGMFTSTNFGGTWTAIPAPTSTDGGTVFGVNPGRQGDKHFSIAADPTSANVVYVGGDTQPVIGANNAVGLAQFAGRVFRFDTATAAWEQVVGNNANNTAPHADSRGLAFAGPYGLLEIDDGGIYRLQNPRNEANQGTRQWANQNRDLRVTEVRELAVDPLSGAVLIGTQDNGSAHQVGLLDTVDNDNDGQTDEADERFFWSAVANGDGNSQAAVPFDSDANGTLDRVIRYSGGNSFSSNNALLATEFDAAGNQIGGTTRIRFRNGPGGVPLSGLSAQDAAAGFTKIPMVVNSINPSRMAIALNGIYESINASLPPGAARVLPLEQVQLVHPAAGVIVTAVNRVSALVYGGTTGGVPNADLIIAARNNRLLIRTAPGGAFTTRNVPGAGRITDIAVNPADWHTVYVTDGTAVFRVADVTNAASPFVRITGNLAAVGLQSLKTLEYVDNGATDILLAGGAGGVARLLNPAAATAAAAVWTRFGSGLPTTVVNDIEYVDADGNGLVNAGDRLVAGTLGRGVWTVEGAGIASLAQPSVLRVLGADGPTAGDHFQVSIDPTNPLRFQVQDLAAAPGTPMVTARFADFDQVEIHTRGGDDVVTIDHTFDPVPVPGGIVVDGGDGTDTLTFIGGAHASRTTGIDPSGLPFVEIRGTNGARQLVLHDDIETVNTGSLPDPLDDPFRAIKGAFRSLMDLLTFEDGLDRDVPLFASSLGRALNGSEVSEGESVSSPDEEEGAPEADQVVEESRHALTLLRRFIETGTGAFRLDDLAGFTTLDQLRAALAGLDESGTGTVSYTGSLAGGFEFTVAGVRKTLDGQADVGLDLLGGKINVDGVVDVEADVTLNVVFGVDAAHGFYIKSNATPELTVSNVRVTADEPVEATGQFGFLGVNLSQVVLNVAPGVRFEADVRETGGDGFIELPELAADLAGHTHVTLVGDPTPGVQDVTVTGTFGVEAILPGAAAPFTLASAQATLTWDDITAADLNGAGNFHVAATVGSPAGEALLRFLKVDAPQLVAQLTDLKDRLSKAIGVEVPFLKGGLAAVTDFTTFFQTEILDPLTGGVGGAAGVPTVQSLALKVAQSLGIDPAALGLSFDPATTELTYHLHLADSVVDKTIPLGAGVNTPQGLADIRFSTDAHVSADLGVDLTFGIDMADAAAGASPLDWFFIRNPSAHGDLAVSADHVAAVARFGFLGIEVFEGTASADAHLQVDLKDPGTTAADGRIDLRELVGAVDHPDTLVSAAVTGSADLSLPLRAPFLGITGTTPTTDNTLAVSIPDFGDLSTATVQLPAALRDVGNFANIDAASLTGLLGQLTFWLDEFRRSDTFANFDIPLVGPALDKVLGVADAFRDKLLLDDADNGLDDAKTLLFDLNAALSAAGLGDRLRAENVGGKIKLIANDATVGQFTVAGATGLGFSDPQTSSGLDTDIFEFVTADNAAPAGGKLTTTDATFTVTIDGGAPVTVTVTKASTDDNTGVGDDRWKLVNADNAPTFSTVQQMVLKLTDILGLSDLAYDSTAQTLTWSLNLAETFGQADLPLGFSLDQLPAFLKLQTNGNIHVAADGQLNLKLGVFLGPAEPSTKLDGTEPLTELNGGIDISTDQRITGTGDVRTAYGQLSADAKFALTVSGGTPVNVTVLKTAAADNATAADLVADLNAALSAAGLASQVQAQAVTDTPGQQRVKLVGLAGVTSLKLTAATTDPTVKDIGFAAQQPATGAPVATELAATKDLPALRGRLTADATFNLSLNNVNGGTPVAITVAAADTATNRFSFDIVGDVQAAIDSHAELKDKIEVGFSGDRLTLTAKNGATSFTVSGPNTAAATELGLGAATGNSVDFVITTRGGTSFPITLDGLTTLNDVIAAISAQTTVGGVAQVTAAINAHETGLTLTDHTTPVGTNKFQVLIANNSRAAIDLGLLQADATDGPHAGTPADPGPDGVIDGTDIAGLTPLDRFFIQATPDGQPPLAGIGVELSTPTPVSATAQFGFVGLTLAGGGALPGPGNKALDASLTVRLKEPAGSTDGRISLAELVGGLDDLGSIVDLSLTGVGKAELHLVPDPALAALGVTLGADARIAVDVNLGNPFADPAVAPTFNLTYPDFGNLLKFGNLNLNFQSIIAGLRQLTDFLDQFEAFDFLDKPLPVVGVSIDDLIAVADKYAAAIDDARNNPAGTLQVLENKLKQAFGLPPSSPAIHLSLVHDDNGTADTADDFDILKVETNLVAAFSKTVGLDFDLGLPVDLGGGADLTASGSAALNLAVGFNIQDPTQVYLFDSTGLDGTLALGGSGVNFRAAVGPLGVFVQDGTVDLHGTVVPGNKLFHAGFDALDFTNHRVPIDFSDLGALFAGFTPQVGGAVDVSLPVYFPTDSIKAGTVLFDASLSYDPTNGFQAGGSPPHAVDKNGNPISLGQLFTVNPSNFSLLDQLLIGVDGMDLFLEGVQDALDGQIGGFTLPLIGDKLAGAADAIGDFRSTFVEGFRTALESLANPGAAGPDPVSKILFQLLGPDGLDLLLDKTGDGVVTQADVTLLTNINQVGVAPADVFFEWDLKLGSTLVDAGAGIGFDLGIPGLGLKTEGDVHVDVNWQLDLGFGLNFADGFYFNVADQSELELNVDVTVPGIGITGTLGFLQVTAVEDVDPTAPDPVTHLGATFAVDIRNRTNPADPRLGFAELGKLGLDVKIGADAVADLAMRLALSSDLVPGAATNFPSVVADFLFDWQLGDRANHQYVSIGDLKGGFLKNGLKYIGFDHVGLDLGKYFTDLIGPIVDKVQEVTEPIKPFLDFLTEPLPVISQLAGPTSLLDIAAMSGLVNPGIIKAIEVVDQVVEIANSIKSASGNAIMYFDRWLPSLVIFDAAHPPAGGALDLTNPNLDLKSAAHNLLDGLGEFLPGVADVLGDAATDFFAGTAKMLPGGAASGGFQLPIIKDPSQVFGMLMGQPADLVTFTMDALKLKADFSAFFSIFGPLGVSINAEFSAQFGPFKFGYDTTGITEFASSGFKNPLLLFDGLYISDLDVPGGTKDVPELQFDAGLWAAAELNLGIARGGVGGGLFAEINFDLHDPDKDGRVRLKELVTNVLNEFKYGSPALSPLAMFDITGQLTARLFAFLKIDFGFFTLDKKFDITDPITLLDFESHFERFPTLATELPGGVLQLNMGKFSGQRIEGDLTDLPEEFHVAQDGPGHVKVWAPSLGVDFSEAQSYDVSSRILALGGEGNDVIDLSGVTDNLEYELEGNAGDDVITAGTGTGAAHILGGPGNDNLTGANGPDLIFGEGGDDTVAGNGGRDYLFGDGAEKDAITTDPDTGLVTLVGLVKANDGADCIVGGAGEDVIFGAGGADVIEGGADADVLIGDGGKATVGGDRIVVTLRPAADDPGRLELAVSDTSKGTKGAGDTIRGDGGNDHVYGGVGDDDLSGGDDADVIYGEAGKDTIHGDGGTDIAFGDFGTFAIINSALTPVTTVGGEADVIFGGTENDQLLGGAGDDQINADAGDDYAWGGAGLDVIHGGAGADHLYGNADPDQLYGEAGADFIEGGGGDDLALGGTENDFLVAGYGSDVLDGEAGSDAYQITARGGPVTELSTAYDSGTVAGEVDTLTLIGTADPDTVLLRAMADFYFPTKVKLIGDGSSQGLTDKIFASREPDKLSAMLQAVEDAYGPHDIPTGLMDDLIGSFVSDVRGPVIAAVTASYAAGPDVPTLDALKARVNGIFDSPTRGKLAEIQKAITLLYGSAPVPATMADAIINAFEPSAAVLTAWESAVDARYQSELTVLGAETDTAFVALINNGGANVERFNYRNMEALEVNTLQGDDYVVSDDVIAPTTINLGIGDDRVQFGQVFRSERVRDPAGVLITGITAEDVFSTTEITRGWLSNGVSRATTANGGDGNDQFTVFRNVAVLNLNGGDGDDLFTVRAFALKGSSDNERARTDMKGDGGADTILYVVNAPVGIDGGDGFDTVRVVGTEFADDFVVTDGGVFGAGLHVQYVNVEKLVADGAEGNDRYFVLSTGLDVVTEIDGGLGSDTFFVGGNPSGAPIPVISDDFKGHSGIILHSVESTDTTWDGLKVPGLSANVGDNEQDAVLVTESAGGSRVVEGATTGGAGFEYDGYSLRLTRAPGAGQVVTINVLLAGQSPEDKARQFRDLEFFAPSSLDTLDGAPHGAPLGFDPLTGKPNLPFLTFTTANWDVPQVVKFRAAADPASEGRRFTFINHTAQNSTDPDYREAQLLSVKVQIDDDDRDGVVVTPTGGNNTLLEGGFTDSYDVVLAQQPTAAVTVAMSVLNGQVTLSGPALAFPGGVPTLTFTPANWNTPQTVTLTAVDDTVLEGFHTDYISFAVHSADVTGPVALPDFIQIDGDLDAAGVQEIPGDKATNFVFLPHRPIAGTVSVKVADVPLDPTRFSVVGNTLSFLAADGSAEKLTGKVEAQYSYLEPGYEGSAVQDAVADIYDNEAPTVIVEQTDGSTDVIEGAVTTDTYRVRLSRAPAQDVVVTADAVNTRTTYGRTTHFVEQVTVNGLSATTLTFTPLNWDTWQTVTVAAIDDGFFDGNDTQVFAPDLQTVNKIRGPLIIEGAAGAGSLSLPAPLMLPSERNLLEPDGTVVSFTPGSGLGATEQMTVKKADLLAVVAELQAEDSTVTALTDLVGKTLELSKGPGTGVVLDAARPRDLFDRFWLINDLEDQGDGNVLLTLQNPSTVDPGLPNVTAPDATTEYAITSLSINFFADERKQVDYLFVFDEDSVADDTGALTSADGAVLDFTPGATDAMTVDTAALQAVAKLSNLTDLTALAGRRLEITVGPGTGRAWTIASVTDLIVGGDVVPGVKRLTLTPVAGGPVEAPTNRSEFRLAGGDTHGRVVGFGMGPNVLFAGKPEPGGITYGDIEVTQVGLGSGNDTVRVDYTTNAEDHTTRRAGDFYTLTLLDTGGGNDTVTAALADGDDGAIAIRGGAGNDVINGGASTLPLVVFGEAGDDQITAGSGADILFGDTGRVDYTNADGQIITRLGHSVPPNPVNPPVESATADTLFDGDANFPTADGGLVGLMVQAISPQGHVQFRRIVANTADTLTVDHGWDNIPSASYFYRISTVPEDQTDGVVRAPSVIWSIDRGVGGTDVISAGGGADFVFGGAAGDTISGDDGADVLVGDSGRIDLSGQEYANGVVDATPVVKHIVTTDTVETSGGGDNVHGNAGADLILGGVNNGAPDVLSGDAGNDTILGDNGEFVYNDPAHPELATLDAVRTLDVGLGGADQIYGNAGADLVLAGTGADRAEGGTENDIVFGDFAEVLLLDNALSTLRTTDATLGGADVLYGNANDDVLVGGALGDAIDGGANQDLIFGDAVEIHRRPGVITNPRFQSLAGTHMYSRTDLDGGPADQSGGVLVDATARDYRNPAGGPPTWAEFEVIDLFHRPDQAATAGSDYIAGGTGDDQIFGQLGDDTIQGDGSIDFASAGTYAAIGTRVGAARDGSNVLLVNPSVETTDDGDDYIEGNGGSDTAFGGLGQDDIVGGSSDLFTLNMSELRADAADLLFGGAGTRIGRNDPGDTSAAGHGRDADVLVGDNGDAFRVVGASHADAGGFLSFNYDLGTLKVIPRAVRLLDYTPGGPDFNPAAAGDLGGNDEAHGEAGDDVAYGMAGSDVLFGDGQDDDLVGNAGNDWLSGGTGQDGLLGDDGRLATSRNGLAEPLNGVAAIPAADLDKLITTPGKMQQATINVSGALKKAADLTPFSVDPAWAGAADEFNGAPAATQHHSDDVLFGGLGGDWLHGGSGDDAVSGAEAPVESYVPVYANGLPAGVVRNDFAHPVNTGDMLAFNAIDPNSRHPKLASRTGQFPLYDEFDPMRKILLTDAGALSKTGAGKEFLLNFVSNDAGAPGVTDPTYGTAFTDGDDALFGDLGNDWLVGGTGRDDMYGGWGNDLLDADDVLTTAGGLNNVPDTHPIFEDRAYGGAGKDVLIGNTGGDRLIDWVGEFNSYLVPFSPFGAATVSRTLQPQLPEYLYALSAADGADPTRATDVAGADPVRNGEPFGELGVVRQKDAAWKDQTGAPTDPQPGNTGGTQRDVLRSSNFNGNQAAAMFPAAGTWATGGGVYAGSNPTGDAVSLFNFDEWLPAYYEVVTNVKLTGGMTNAYIVFDYQSATDFKYAGLDAAANLLRMGRRTAAGWVDTATVSASLNGANFVATLAADGPTATLTVGSKSVSYTFADALNDGFLALGARNGTGSFTSVSVQKKPKVFTYQTTEDFADGVADRFSPQGGAWAVTGGRYAAVPPAGGEPALTTRPLAVAPLSYVELQAAVKPVAGATAGIVFGYTGPQEFLYAAVVPGTNQVVLGHRTPAGWFVDATAARTVTAGADQTLLVAIDKLNVSVVLNGQNAVSFNYTFLPTGGAVGLLTRGGNASFDNVVIRGDDPAYTGGSPLRAAAAVGPVAPAPQPLTAAQLQPIYLEALRRWRLAGADVTALRQVAIQIADLPGAELGETIGRTVRIDPTAGGWGWFVDRTPRADSEFRAAGDQGEQGHMDLLTAVMHEVGHALGRDHESAGVMAEDLDPGERRSPTPAHGPVGHAAPPVVRALKGGWFLSRFFRR